MTQIVLLGDVAAYVTEKIAVSDVSIANYVSTENLIPDKGGVVLAASLPQSGRVTKYQKGDVLISNIRPYFKKIWFADRDGGASNDVLVFRPTNNSLSRKYLRYILTNDQFFDYSTASSGGSKMPRGDKTQIMKYQIYLPGLDEQKKIVDILGTFDEKITLNRQMNETLEQIGRLLFKHYFINNPKESAWNTRTLGEFFDVKTGKKDANFGTENGKYPFFTCSQKTLKAPDFSFDGPALLLAGNGDFNLKYYRGKFEAYQRTYVLMPHNEEMLGYLFFLMSLFLDEITNGSRGSVIKFITKGMIENFKIKAPDDNTILKLSVLLNQITINIEKNNEEIQTLTDLRDTLLPRLISGKIKL